MSESKISIETSSWYRCLVILGGGALFMVMLIEVVAVVGRHIGLPLLGSIELIQVLIGISGTLSILVATLHGSHAMVRLIINLISDANARRAKRIGALISATFFICLWLGSMWIAKDLWSAFEESELWHLPFKPLRILVSGAVLLVALTFVVHAWKGEQR